MVCYLVTIWMRCFLQLISRYQVCCHDIWRLKCSRNLRFHSCFLNDRVPSFSWFVHFYRQIFQILSILWSWDMFRHSKDSSFQGQQTVYYAKSQNNHFSVPKNAKKHENGLFWPFFHMYENRKGHFSPKRLDGIFFSRRQSSFPIARTQELCLVCLDFFLRCAIARQLAVFWIE